ncbi:MAG: hypothetical protein LDLANPLL_00459 [Turneriella sp.]|nr:hypothetical protein [Turneriella sp.]
MTEEFSALFSEGDLGVVSVGSLAKEVLSAHGCLKLPAFQRDAAWNESRIQLLWDSLIRGFPVGTFLFAEAKDYKDAQCKDVESQGVSVAPSPLIPTTDTIKYLIIDGQQRIIAISMGFREWKPEDISRLWIDLEQNKDTKGSYDIYLTTIVHPWGHGAPKGAIVKALKSLGLSEDIDRSTSDILDHTWPAKATLPVSLAALLKLFAANDLKNIDSIVPKWLPNSTRSRLPSIDMQSLVDLCTKIMNFKTPVFRINKLDGIEDLGEAFLRINSQGVSMSQEDLFFAGLKMVWPEAHNLVWDIHRDSETGKVLSATKIVHNVARIAVAKTESVDHSDLINLTAASFRTLVKPDEPEETIFLKNLKKQLEVPVNEESSQYHNNLRLAKKLLCYDPTNDIDDVGFPIQMLAELSERVWHTATAWLSTIDTRQLKGEVWQKSRLELLRYALLDHFHLTTTRVVHDYFTIPFQVAMVSQSEIFPGKQILRELRERSQYCKQLRFHTVTEFETEAKNWKTRQRTSVLDRNEHNLATWNQRYYLHKWYPNYDPTLYHTQEDLPFDWDHIIAADCFNQRGDMPSAHEDFQTIRAFLVECVGNYRLWPKHLNRSDQADNLWRKFILGDSQDSIPDTVPFGKDLSYLTSKPFGFKTIGEIRQASAIPEDPEILKNWETACHTKKKESMAAEVPWHSDRSWDKKSRIDAFSNAVNARRVHLYKVLYESLALDSWQFLEDKVTV